MTGEPTTREHERLRDDLAAYALDALDGEEKTALEQHLDACEPCRTRLRWLRPAVDVLPAAVEQRTPPDRLRENLLATVRAEAEAGAEPSSDARRRWWDLRGFALRPATGIAAVLLIVAGIGLANLLSDPAGDEPVFVEAEAPSGLAGDVSATLERRGDAAILHVQNLPRIDRDDVYEVWVQRGETMKPASLFVLNRQGTAEAAVPGPLEGADAVLVTREPRGGSQQPTNPPLLQAPLQ